MGRLIDADKLLENQYRIDDSATLSTRDVVNVEDIEDAPTVEAIPRERINDMVAEIQDVYIGYRHGYEVMNDVMLIIHKYTKEQEDGNDN